MPNTIEEHDGELLDAVQTQNDDDATGQLMVRTGLFLNMVEHCARFHPEVLVPEFFNEIAVDLDNIRTKFGVGLQRH